MLFSKNCIHYTNQITVLGWSNEYSVGGGGQFLRAITPECVNTHTPTTLKAMWSLAKIMYSKVIPEADLKEPLETQ